MASLGKLWFELGLIDNTEKEAEKIRKGILNKLKALNVNVGLDESALKTSIENALKGHRFKIDVVVDKANTTKLIQDAIAKAGVKTNVSASDVRAERIKQLQEQMANAADKHRLTVEKLQAQIDKLRSKYDKTSSSATRYSNTLGGITKNMRTQFNLAVQLRNQIADIYSIYTAERFLTSIIKIGGEFQQQRVALQTMFKDAQKADVLFGQIKELSVESPFEFKELAGYTKQLAAFNIPYEEMFETTKRLADISAGVGVDMGRIILAYGQVRSAEFLKGSELRQFTEAGIPLLQELADNLTKVEGKTVSIGEVFDKISKREIPFEKVKEVLWELTNEGGQFYNMQAALADTLAGKLSNLRDAYDIMLADIAQSNNSTLSSGLDLLTSMMKHWEGISDAVLTVIATYGAYKTAVVALIAVKNILKNIKTASLFLEEAQAIMNGIRAIRGLTAATKTQIAVQKVWNTVFAKNPIGLIAPILASAVAGFMLFKKETKSTDETITALNESLGKLSSGMEQIANNNKLIDEYEELSKKQNKTAEETERLESLTKQLSTTFKGAEASVDQYGIAISMSIGKMRKLSREQKQALIDTWNINLESGKKSLEAVQSEIKENQEAISSLENNTSLRDDLKEQYITKYKDRVRELRLEEIKLQGAINETSEEIQNFNKAQQEENTKNDNYSLWQWRAMQARFKYNFIPEVSPSYGQIDYLESLKKVIDDLEEKQASISQSNEYTAASFKDYADKIKVLKDLYVELGGAEKNKSEKGKDPIAERFKRQADLMKEAMDTYNKYVTSLGKEGAIKEVNKNPRFAGLDFDPDKYVENLNRLLSKAENEITRSDSLIKVRDAITKIITNFNSEEIKKSTEHALEIMRRTIEENTAKWDLYKDLFSITGNREMSMNLAFGVNAPAMDGIYSQVDLLKNELLSRTGKTYDELKDLSDQKMTELLGSTADIAKELLGQIRSVSRQESEEVIKDALNIAQQYADADKKIKALESQRDAKIAALHKNPLFLNSSQEEQQFMENGIIQEFANQIREIQEESVALLPIWQKLFGDTTELGYQSLKKLLEEAQRFVDTAQETKNPKTGETEYTLTGIGKNGETKEVTISLEAYLKLLKQIRNVEKDMNSENPFETLVKSIKEFAKAKDGSEEKEKALKQIGISAQACSQMIAGVTDAWAGMFSALGNDGAADALSFAGDMLGEIGNLAQGMTSGNPIQMATSALTFIPNIISKIAQFHDKKLDRAIQKSALEVQKLQNAYANMETALERQLGQMTKKQYDSLYKNLLQQRSEIQEQMQLESEKKDVDDSKIEDYKKQLAEITDQIEYFAEDMAAQLYSIDLKDWAGQFTDSLVNAWRNGEDAADAFGKTASDVLAQVANDMLRMAIIEPMFEELRDKVKAFMSDDGKLDQQELGDIAESLLNIQDGYNQGLAYLDQLEKIIQEKTNGELSLKDVTTTNSDTNKGSGIQASEETMQLTNSYLNAIRQDVSVKRNLLEKLINSQLPTLDVVTQAQLKQLNAIAANTQANATAAQAIQEALSSVITVGNGGKAIRIK